MGKKMNLDKLKNRKVNLASSPAFDRINEQKTEAGSTETEQVPSALVSQPALELPVVTPQLELTGKLKKVLSQNEAMTTMSKANLQTFEYLINEFNHIRNYAKAKKQKTTVTTMVSNILQDWLQKNADDIEKTFGYRPFSG